MDSEKSQKFANSLNFNPEPYNVAANYSQYGNVVNDSTQKSPRKLNGNFSESDILETVEWIHTNTVFESDTLDKWIEKGAIPTTASDETHFCDFDLFNRLAQVKREVFEKYDANQLLKARIRANPFETIRSAFFMNRAALKMANVDAVTGFMFSSIDRHPDHRKPEGPYYFADVCAGPGGFSEYMLWRKQWAFKGFGFTLRGTHDFRLYDSSCSADATFQPYYGIADDGDICNPDNIRDFADKVKFETDSLGVHFMMADGGFSVDGHEDLQEILSKQLYACQCLVALEIVRKGGHFVTKLFDTFTVFTVGLLFLMAQCFDEVTILKPNTSRPANSERYFICKHLKNEEAIDAVRKYLRKVISEFWLLKNSNVNEDIISIVPLKVISEDQEFFKWILEHNNRIGRNQMRNLLKLETYCQDTSLIDSRQEDLRKRCLMAWNIPDKKRGATEKFSIDDLLSTAMNQPDYLYAQPEEILNFDDLPKFISDSNDWQYCPIFSSGLCEIYAATTSSKPFKLQNFKWNRVKNLRLVKGTLLFGEMVLEKVIDSSTLTEVVVKSLHIIDALRLGDTSLADLPFSERLSLIRTYCKAVNFETGRNSVRVRVKESERLINLPLNNLIQYNDAEQSYFSVLPKVGISSNKEYYDVNAILFLKTNDNHLFNTTYVLRVMLHLNNIDNEDKIINIDTLKKHVENQRLHELQI